MQITNLRGHPKILAVPDGYSDRGKRKKPHTRANGGNPSRIRGRPHECPGQTFGPRVRAGGVGVTVSPTPSPPVFEMYVRMASTTWVPEPPIHG